MFYAVLALLARDNSNASTHNGVRTEFFKRYIKTEMLDKDFSSFYSDLMGKRHESDYDDFLEFFEKDIKPLFSKAKDFIDVIRKLINF